MRLKNIVLTDLIHKRLIAYEELERAMNEKTSIDKSVSKVKHYLKEISRLNGMITEWQVINGMESEMDDKLGSQQNINNG